MSASDVTLTVRCNNPAAQLFVIDGEFNAVHRGESPLTVTVVPGVYALRAKVGDAVSERIEILRARDQAYEFVLEPPKFESPLPLDGTSTTHEYQSGTLAQFTGDAAVGMTRLGDSSAVVFYLRDSSDMTVPADQQPAYAANFKGFRLLSARGAVLVDLYDKAEKHIDGGGFMGAQVRVDPGFYVLAWERDGESLCLPLYTARDWALQIYVQLQPVQESAVEMRPDFRNTSYVFDRLDAKFFPGREDLKTIESVRLALQKGRNIIQASTMRDLLTRKFQNPILGLYAAHLLLMEDNRDLALLDEVIGNIAEMLGDGYPDVVALAWEYERLAGKRPVKFGIRAWTDLLEQLEGPPLLVKSWDLLVACAESVAPGRFGNMKAFEVAGNLVSAGTYLAWRPSPRVDAVAAARESVPLRAPMGALGALTGLTRTVLSFGKDLLVGAAAMLPEPVQTQFGAAKLGDITDLREAAAAFRLVAGKYPWSRILPALRREQTLAASLSAFQRDLIIAMRSASAESSILNAIDEKFIENLLRAHRVPLESLASALRGLDLIANGLSAAARWARRIRKADTPAAH